MTRAVTGRRGAAFFTLVLFLGMIVVGAGVATAVVVVGPVVRVVRARSWTAARCTVASSILRKQKSTYDVDVRYRWQAGGRSFEGTRYDLIGASTSDRDRWRSIVDRLVPGAHTFEPGARVSGTASWRGDRAPKSVEVRLFWHTNGVGDADLSIIETIPFDAPIASDRRPFVLDLPQAPPSFRGKLVQVAWALELVVMPGEEATRVDISSSGRRATRLNLEMLRA